MNLKLNNVETEVLIKAISYVLDINELKNIQDVIELVYTLQSGSGNSENNIEKASKVNYGTIISVLENFIVNVKNVKKEELYNGANIHVLLS